MSMRYNAAAVAAVRQLKSRYCRLLDLKQWDEWGELFLRDAVMIVKDDVPAELGDPTLRGRDAIVAQVRSLMHAARTAHQVHEPDIVLKSRTTAEGIWPMHDVVVWPEGVAAPVPFRTMQGFGFYYEKYRRIRKRWYIASLDLRRVHMIKS